MAEGEDPANLGGGYPRPYSHVIPATSYAHDMASHRLSDSRFFFSERRLSQLFNVDAWTEEGEEGQADDFADDEDAGHDPPPEPAPRASYCPPSPGTPGDAVPQAPSDAPYAGARREPSIYSTLSSGCHLDPRFSAEVALDMARLSTLSGGSGRFSTGRLEDEDEDGYGGGNNGDVTPTPGSPGSCRGSHSVSSRYSQLSTLTDFPGVFRPPVVAAVRAVGAGGRGGRRGGAAHGRGRDDGSGAHGVGRRRGRQLAGAVSGAGAVAAAVPRPGRQDPGAPQREVG
ncbi:translation initiation factor IF-2-like [Penaeus monodon]|uniref:translation initiation factor IF-2-like n=1 Tax=Penaeus monodon TaxID=6687 RepID=UPI0018A789B2|nr:translation initiation factor IF-2-like [Penaeus monodon]